MGEQNSLLLYFTEASVCDTLGEKLTGPRAKGDQSWVFTGRTDVEAETPILWPPDEKS